MLISIKINIFLFTIHKLILTFDIENDKVIMSPINANQDSPSENFKNLETFGIRKLSVLSKSRNKGNWTFNFIHGISLMIFHHSVDWSQINALDSKKVEKFLTQYNKIKNCIINCYLAS